MRFLSVMWEQYVGLFVSFKVSGRKLCIEYCLVAFMYKFLNNIQINESFKEVEKILGHFDKTTILDSGQRRNGNQVFLNLYVFIT